jgi:hypothetical protein
MRKIEFDELQQSRRYRYGYQSFLFLAILLMADSVLYGVGIIWAQYPTNTFILLLTACVYYISRCILGDALVGPKDTPARMTARTAVVMIIAIAAAIILAGYLVMNIKDQPSADNGGSLLSAYCSVMWVVIGIVFIIKRIRDTKKE